MVKHVFKELGVALFWHALIGCTWEVTIIIADKDWNATCDGLVNLVWSLTPLLHGVVQEDVLINVVSNLFQIWIVLLAKLHDRNFDVLTKRENQLLIEFLATLFSKGKLQRLVVKRNRHQLAVNVSQNFMLVVSPLSKAREELVNTVTHGVVDVWTVLVNKNARVIKAIVSVAGNVVSALKDCYL